MPAGDDIYLTEIEALQERLAAARTLILAAPLFMPTWPENEGRNSWVRDADKWLKAT